MRFVRHIPVSLGARAVGDLVCTSTEDGQISCMPGRGDSHVEGLPSGPCVSLATKRWHAPGTPLHKTKADVQASHIDPSGQAWAEVGPNRVVVPACIGTFQAPSQQAQSAVSLGAVRNQSSVWYAPPGVRMFQGPTGTLLRGQVELLSQVQCNGESVTLIEGGNCPAGWRVMFTWADADAGRSGIACCPANRAINSRPGPSFRSRVTLE